MVEFLFLLLAANNSCFGQQAKVFLPDIISSPLAHEGLDWVSDDQTIVLFTRATSTFSSSSLMQARKIDDEWTVEPLPISASDFDAGIAISPTMASALFTSTRLDDDGEAGNWNLWQMDATFDGKTWAFGEPTMMPAPVNSSESECCVVYGENEEFYFSSDRAGSWDIYHAEPRPDGYHVAKLSGEINTADGAWPSAYQPSSKQLLFSSIRETGAGGDDIYISTLNSGDWAPGRPLGRGINQSGYEDSARIFGQTLYWSSRPKTPEKTRDLNVSNIYTMPTTCIDGLG